MSFGILIECVKDGLSKRHLSNRWIKDGYQNNRMTYKIKP